MSKSPRTSPRGPTARHSSDRTCCGVVTESVSDARRNRRKKPQPWVIRKIWILFTLGIIGYSGYAYIARLCMPMITRKSVLGSQITGILLLIFFSILYLWMIWAYVTVVLTAPGYARDHVPRTDRPPLSDFSATTYYGRPYQDGAPPNSETTNPEPIEGQKPSLSEKTSQTSATTRPLDGDSATEPSYGHTLRTDSTLSQPSHAKEPNAGVLDTIIHPPLPTVNKPHISIGPSDAAASQQDPQTLTPALQSRREVRKARKLSKQVERNSRLDHLNIFRKPSSAPILQPVFLYCDTDELIRPYRAHHCRVCGTCVLRYDHHCPWIGQCVGARNHKFFLNFCFATSIFAAYVFASDLYFVIRSMRPSYGDGSDPHFLVLVALAAVFWLFTAGLSASHVRLITHGQTTVESMQIKAMQDREDHVLSRAFAWWECGPKRRRKKAFDEEWGSLNTEGNIWWRGSAYKEWTDVMGKHWFGWICPIGSGLSDGSSYQVNPRFDSDGRLRKRSEWPQELR